MIKYKSTYQLWSISRKNCINNQQYLRLQGLKGELFELLMIRGGFIKKYDQVLQLNEKIHKYKD